MLETANLVAVYAYELKAGDQIPEQDGFLFDVTEVVEQGSNVVVTLKSDFSSDPSFQKGKPQTFKHDLRLYKYVA